MLIKERRTKILLSLFLFSGPELAPVNLSENIAKIFDFSFNQKTKGTISGLLKEGLIEKSETNTETKLNEQNDQKKYRLTEAGFYSLCLEFPFFRYLRDKWDGKWRIISYEIPESRREIRDRLRREMQGWGLGPWHRSFWLTPHPIINDLKNLVSQKETEKYIQAFESDHVFGDRINLIEKVWQKSILDKKYRELFKKWHDLLSQNEDKIVKLTKIVGEYVGILKVDPGLPKELVGDSWIAFEAFSIFKEIRGILLS